MGAGLVAALGLSLLQGTVAQAAPGMCDREPRDPVAQLCATTSANMYGSFTTFMYPLVSHGSSAGNAYNSTRVFTDDVNMSTSYETGLDVGWGSPTGGTTYRAYWVDYTGGYTYHPIGDFKTEPDDRPHTFMSLPHCDSCRSTDIFYDFNYAGTTKDGVNAASHHMVTGWLLTSDAYNNITFARTSNRIQWLTGNMTWAKFPSAEVKTRAPNGDCSIGSHPAYCWRFETNTARDASGAVVSWDVTKPSVSSLNATPAAQRSVQRSKVDQDRLQECIENDASQCMDTVPGLRDCVQKRLVCNETAAIESGIRMRSSALTVQDAKTTSVNFLVERKALSGNAEAVSAKDDGTTVTVSITGAVRELTGDRRSHERAELTFDRASHALLSVHMS